MSKKASPAAIGGFVLGAIALLVTAIIVLSGGKLLRDKTLVVSYFPGTVAGLNVGAPVQFQGVQVGQVTDVKLDFYRSDGHFSIPVPYEIWADAVNYHDADDTGADSSDLAMEALYRSLIEESGLRAMLRSASVVTGQYVISLQLLPDSDYEYVGTRQGMLEIPTAASARDRLADVFQELDLKSLVANANQALGSISSLVSSDSLREMPGNVDALVLHTRTLVDNLDTRAAGIASSLDATLVDYRTLATTATTRIDAMSAALDDVATKMAKLTSDLDAKLDPVARSAIAALDTVQETVKSYGGVVDPQSTTRTNLDQLLEEAAGAARSLRILADYLEQNPDALIKGKY